MKNVLALLSFFLLFSVKAWALEFSGDAIFSYGNEKLTGKIFYKADRFRMDVKVPEEVITISRIDKKVIWSIIPKEKMYMEMPFDLGNKPMVTVKVEGEIERRHVGDETIDGHPTKKYLITYQSGGIESKVYQWLATDINFPIKTSAVDGSWGQEYRNIEIGSQPGHLFEVPEGYEKFQMPAGMDFR